MELTDDQWRLWNELDMSRRGTPTEGQTLAQARNFAAQTFVWICQLEGAEPLPDEELVRAELG